MMKAIRSSDYNAAPSLEEIAKPVAGAGEVLVRVKAASLNPLDVKLQRGYMEQFFPLQFPYTLGTGLAGRVEEIGPDVLGWSIGDRVIARTDPTAGGAMAAVGVVPAPYLTTAPSTVPLYDAAGLSPARRTARPALVPRLRTTGGPPIH